MTAQHFNEPPTSESLAPETKVNALAVPDVDGDASAIDLPFSSPVAQTLSLRLNQIAAEYLPLSDQTLLLRCCHFADTLSTTLDQVQACIEEGIILAEMRIDATGIITGIVQHLAIDPASNTLIPAVTERIAQEFGPDSTYLLESIARFSAIEQRKGKRVSQAPRASDLPGDRHTRDRDDKAQRDQIEKIRKMFVAMGDDPRVVVFKLAEHLQRMRSRNLSADELRALAKEARDIYAPLAARLGMSRIEAELEDLAFERLDPDECRRVKNLVAQVRAEQQAYIQEVCAVLRAEAARHGIDAEVSGRFKHLWSIYRKLVRNGWDISQVYDLVAFRIIVPRVEDCYAMLGQVHALWKPNQDRIKDFIAHRKPNGYQSLHTTVFCLGNRLAEIQIRTHEMHQNAEYGVATHWYYKDIGDNASYDKKLRKWLQQLRDWQSDLQQHVDTKEEAELTTIDPSPSRQQVFVFTPHGDVRDLPSGSTPVDFAYRIHSTLGDHCAGARIITNGPTLTPRLVPLDYELQNGEIVEILTRKDAHPTRDWLSFVHTHAARNHINRYLKEHERDIYIAVGRERFERESRSAGLGTIDSIGEELLRAAAEEHGYATTEDMFAAIGGDTLRSSKVLQGLSSQIVSHLPEKKEPEISANVALPSAEAVLNLAGAGGLLARLANCCHPLPGDPIAGYISRGHGIVIHHTACRSMQRLRERERERLVEVDWDQMRLNRYEAGIVVIAQDRRGLLRDVTQQIHEMKVNMGAVSTTTSRKGLATIALTLQISEVRQLDEAIARIRAIRDIETVSRDLRNLAMA